MEKKNKRNAILYVRISEDAKEWLLGQAHKFNIESLSEYVEKLIHTLRMKGKHARNKRKLRKSS